MIRLLGEEVMARVSIHAGSEVGLRLPREGILQRQMVMVDAAAATHDIHILLVVV